MEHVDRVIEPLPDPAPAIASYLGESLPVMRLFAAHLADTGVSHGLIGPREVPRLWDRHIANCAVVTELIEPDAKVADVGSGAGLPGIVIAVARPDVHVTLIEPLQRRVTWLDQIRDDLELDNVEIRRSRAELVTDLAVDVVTSRAVARLDTLSTWSLPLLRAGGRMLALKGSSAQEELDEARAGIEQLGGSNLEIVRCGVDVVDPPTSVVSVLVQDRVARPTKPAKTKSAARAGREQRRHRPQRRK